MVISNKASDLNDPFDSFEHSAFRLETLPVYSVPEEADDFQRFLSGESLPISMNEEWCDWTRQQTLLGKTLQRVRVISLPLSSYLRFEIDWRYVYSNVAGEEIYLLEKSKIPADMLSLADFWLFDGRVLVRLRYDSNGHFIAEEADIAASSISIYREAATSLLSLGTPLKQFLADIRNAGLRED